MASAGYSGTPLVRKLGFKPGMRVHYAAAPDGFAALVGELPDGVRVLARPRRISTSSSCSCASAPSSSGGSAACTPSSGRTGCCG